MKCKSCGFENRKGVKFCEQCGEPLSKEKAVLFCTNCGHKNRRGVKFCEECGTAMGGTTAAAPAPAAQAQQPPVVVIQQEGRKRRFNPVLLVLVLLLLIIPACCLLMLFGQVETPAFAQAFVDPVIEQVREQVRQVLPGLPLPPPHDNNNGGDQKAGPCDEFADIMKSIHDFEMDCTGINFDQDCRVEFVLDGPEYFETHADEEPFWKNTQILYQWENGKAGDSEDCWHNTVGGEVKVTCDFPKDRTSDHVDLHLVVEDCTECLDSQGCQGPQDIQDGNGGDDGGIDGGDDGGGEVEEDDCNVSKFVSETIPDHTYMSPGQAFTKTCTVRNAGTCTWNTGYSLDFTQGTQMGGEKSIPVTRNVAPGETFTFEWHMTAPSSPGSYLGRWDIFDNQGNRFSWCSVVIDVATSESQKPACSSELDFDACIAAGGSWTEGFVKYWCLCPGVSLGD